MTYKTVKACSGLDFQVNVLKTSYVVPSLLGSGEPHLSCSLPLDNGHRCAVRPSRLNEVQRVVQPLAEQPFPSITCCAVENDGVLSKSVSVCVCVCVCVRVFVCVRERERERERGLVLKLDRQMIVCVCVRERKACI